MFEVIVEIGLKAGIFARRGVSSLDRQDQRHQGLGDKAPAIDAEMAALVRSATKGVRDLHPQFSPKRPGSGKKCPDLVEILFPRTVFDTGGDIDRRRAGNASASGNSSGVKPPDSIHTRRQERPAIRPQSKARPLPPG